MKEDQLLPSDRNLYRSTRPVLLLLVAALVGFVTTNSAVFGQSKQELCQNNKTRLAELEKQAQTLQEELSFTNGTEDNARALLSALNKALVDPHSSEPGHFVRVYLRTPADRQMAVEKWGGGLPWKDEYLDDDVLLLSALRDAGIRRVVRVKYVLTHKAEIPQQKANADQQIAYHRNRLAELQCGESSSSATASSVNLTGTWICKTKCPAGGENKPATISQNGRDLTFTNEGGGTSQGHFEGDSQVVATGWGNLRATIANGGRTLNWTNGTVWVKQ